MLDGVPGDAGKGFPAQLHGIFLGLGQGGLEFHGSHGLRADGYAAGIQAVQQKGFRLPQGRDLHPEGIPFTGEGVIGIKVPKLGFGGGGGFGKNSAAAIQQPPAVLVTGPDLQLQGVGKAVGFRLGQVDFRQGKITAYLQRGFPQPDLLSQQGSVVDGGENPQPVNLAAGQGGDRQTGLFPGKLPVDGLSVFQNFHLIGICPGGFGPLEKPAVCRFRGQDNLSAGFKSALRALIRQHYAESGGSARQNQKNQQNNQQLFHVFPHLPVETCPVSTICEFYYTPVEMECQ